MTGAAAVPQLIGRSAALRQVVDRLRCFAPSPYAVMIAGETGTGKELAARLLHHSSPRRAHPMVSVSCAAFPETLIETELFGHKRGAFTGAFADREGRFAAAHRGTLFLDEISEISLPVQAKLLRVLQEGRFEPLGTNQPQQVEVRIVSATHRDLAERVRAGLFREDLYYRLKVLDVTMPPLRQRHEDVPLLVEFFLQRLAPQPYPHGVSARAMAALMMHPFPGNVRELEHAVTHAAVLAHDELIELHHLPAELLGAIGPPPEPPSPAAPGAPLPLAMALQMFEKEYLQRALQQMANNRSRVAGALGITRKNLWQKLRRHGLLQLTGVLWMAVLLQIWRVTLQLHA